jgi:NADPH-dependent glutamate synthase beta subunit-like oxidoreductase
MLKNGGAVGGPKNAIGQHMLKRLHARSEWKNLYVCGDSTVMGTGAPATMVSGVGAANMVLRDLHKQEYDTRKFPKQYVRFVDIPYTRSKIAADDSITPENAYLVAAQCQGCEHPACVAGCPAGIDVPGFLRRMEARNYAGAARLLRERNPFAEVCGYTCAADDLCQKRCYRKSFAGAPVRIAELERWVCEATGDAGWLRLDGVESAWRVAVMESDPSGLTCAYYLALMGLHVDVYDQAAQPGGQLLEIVSRGNLPRAVLDRALRGVLLDNIHFDGGRELVESLDLKTWMHTYNAVYLTSDASQILAGDLVSLCGADWRTTLDPVTRQVASQPGLYIGGEYPSVVEAVAEGRRVAVNIGQDDN